MKTQRTKKQLNVHALLVSIAICFLFIPNCYSSIKNETSIDLRGNWYSDAGNKEINRSLPILPISAYLLDSYISIQNEKPDCDITINIINCTTGDVVYQQTAPKATTSNILIPTSNLASGEYILELISSGGKHLEGNFSK